MKYRILALLALVLTFLPMQAEKTIKVACIGNSITYGSLVDNREINAYPAVLQRMLGDGYEVGNFGRPGATLLRTGHRPYDRQPQFRDALAFVPDIAVIKIGINDTDPSDWAHLRDNFAADYAWLIDTLRSVNPSMRVLVSRLAPVTASHKRFSAGTRQWRDSINILIEGIAAAKNLELIDLGGSLVDHPNLLPDALHPNVKGARMMAQTAYEAITGNYGGLRMSPVYADGMVLQRRRPLTISGHANAGERVTVTLGNDRGYGTADNRGRWSVTLPPQEAAEALTMTVSTPGRTLTFSDVAVGEVWLAAGQSNMEFPLVEEYKSDSIMAAASDPGLRFFHMKPKYITNAKRWPEESQAAVDSLDYYSITGWKAIEPKGIRRLSAVAYHFAQVLRDSLQVPVGIIANPVGGSATESWVDIELLNEYLPEILVDWRRNPYIDSWVHQRVGQNTGTDSLGLTHRHPYEPGYLFAAGMRPLEGYPVEGMIWYQGESNASNMEVHEILFPLVVESVRKNWDSPEMPVIFAQLSALSRPSWPAFRDSQRRMAEKIDNTYMAVTHDYGDSLDVHPKFKTPVGRRLARQALHNVYGFDGVVPEGPKPVSAVLTPDDEIVITFDYADGLTTTDGTAPRIFEIAGEDGIFTPTEARIEGNTVILRSVGRPTHVRYGWQPFTRANLVNGAGLPASTFRIPVGGYFEKEQGIDSGLSGCAFGFAGGKAIIAGGCNFPVNPLAPKSKKKFYRGIYSVDEQDLILEGKLPYAVAYSASATVPDGLVIAGGMTPSGSTSAVLLVHSDYTVTELPPLPVRLDNASGAAIGPEVYVAGGNADGVPSNAIYMLDTDKIAQGWKILKPFPGNPRTQAAMAASGGKIYLFGGFAPGSNPTLETTTLCYDPARNRWKELPAPPEGLSLGGGAAATLPDGRIVAVGGVNAEIFLNALRATPANYLSHPAKWYKFNPNILIFNPKQAKWSLLHAEGTARAGAALFPVDTNKLMLYGGEIKPRIRTPRVKVFSVEP